MSSTKTHLPQQSIFGIRGTKRWKFALRTAGGGTVTWISLFLHWFLFSLWCRPSCPYLLIQAEVSLPSDPAQSHCHGWGIGSTAALVPVQLCTGVNTELVSHNRTPHRNKAMGSTALAASPRSFGSKSSPFRAITWFLWRMRIGILKKKKTSFWCN